MFQDLSSVEPR